MKNKIVVLDWSIYLFRSTYAYRNNPIFPASFTAMRMILGNLKRIGINPDDKIIVACDGRGNWRKAVDKNYKLNRKEQRDKSGIDFKKIFGEFDYLLKQLDQATNWHILKFDQTEADDIASIVCKTFSDSEIILCSYDKDWEILWNNNVKIFSPMTKRYKIKPKNFNVYKLISQKIKKEASDNLVNPILSKEDFEKREKIVNLLQIPEFIENPIKESLKNLPDKGMNLDLLPYKRIRNDFMEIYNSDKIITYKQCEKRKERKLKRKGGTR